MYSVICILISRKNLEVEIILDIVTLITDQYWKLTYENKTLRGRLCVKYVLCTERLNIKFRKFRLNWTFNANIFLGIMDPITWLLFFLFGVIFEAIGKWADFKANQIAATPAWRKAMGFLALSSICGCLSYVISMVCGFWIASILFHKK